MSDLSRRSLLRSTAAFGGATLLANAWSFGSRAATQETLTLYNGQHRSTTEALVAAFTKETGIGVTMRNAESPELASQLIEEGASSPADLFYSEQSPPIASLAEKGLLAPVDAETLKQIPATYSAKDGSWIGGTIRGRVIGYNKTLIATDALPSSIMEFATPALAGKFAYVIQDGFQEQIMAIAVLKGREAALDWLKGVKKYGKSYNGNRVAMNAVENGEIPMALTNNYYWYSMAKEKGADKLNSAIHLVGKQDAGALLTVSAAGILKSSKKSAMAQKFLAFLVGEKGQQAMIDTVGEYPVRAGIKSPFNLPPMEQYGAAPVSSADIGGAAEAYALEREAGLI
jgi:iron(III) transport system substrate-binding protein